MSVYALQKHLKESMWEWRRLYGAEMDNEKYYIRDWSKIGMRLPSHDWVSCWGSGSTCKPRSCPRSNGERTDESCRGERFEIVSNKGGYIKTCDTVGLRYSYQNNKGYWLSNYGIWLLWVDTKICPGKHFKYIQSSQYCRAEKWTIKAAGKNCNEPIEHLDAISLKGHHYKLYLGNTRFHMYLTHMKYSRKQSATIFLWGYDSSLYE